MIIVIFIIHIAQFKNENINILRSFQKLMFILCSMKWSDRVEFEFRT